MSAAITYGLVYIEKNGYTPTEKEAAETIMRIEGVLKESCSLALLAVVTFENLLKNLFIKIIFSRRFYRSNDCSD